MRRALLWLGLLGPLALGSLPAPAAAQPVGSEFQINTYTTSEQLGSAIAGDETGSFVVVWQSRFQDGSEWGIFGQRYDSAGSPLGSEFRVNSYTTSIQDSPSIASDASGNFVVVWDSRYQDGSLEGIFGQRYDSQGGALGVEFRVNTYTTSSQSGPALASDASGNLVVVWTSSDGSYGGIFGQRYDSGGMALGSEFRVNSYTTRSQVSPAVASDPSGNFVVVWRSSRQDGSNDGIFGQRYDSAGNTLGSEFRVNSYTTSGQSSASVASDTSGNFVVVWSSYGQDGSSAGIFGQRYDSAGETLGSEFRVNSYTTDIQQAPSVASDASGHFLVVWSSEHQDGSSSGIFGQRYDSEGGALGSEFQINSFTSRFQQGPSVEATGTNQFVVTWSSYSQDGSGDGVFGQRFDFSGGVSTIHVGDLDRKAKNVGTSWRAQVKALVHDATHLAESGVLVRFSVSAGVGVRTCETVASGVCEVSVVVGDAVPSLTFTVTSLSKAGFSYDAAANHDPEPDSNGTTIVVSQP